MKQVIISTIILFFIILSSSCRKDFSVQQSKGNFRTSTDTLFLDSVFTNIASRTYSFKIYNTSDKDINIPKIYLENGNNSFYRLNVDGTPGKSFENVLIHKNDSVFVFAEVTADITQLSDPVYEENVIIEDNDKQKKVLLTSFVKDADFYYPTRFPDGSKDSLTTYTDPQTGETTKIAGFFLPGNTTFTSAKPVVIYGHLAIPENATLTIEQGTHIYFHYNSGIIAWENSTLKVNGTLGNEVIFEDDRMEPDFENKPGMWDYIWLRQNSKNNEINYAIIKNASVGVEVFPASNYNPALLIKNTKIYNCRLVGLFGIASKIVGENLVMNNFGVNAFRGVLGGNYDFKHCTFANYSGGVRNEKSGAVYASNFVDTKENGEDVRYINDLTQFNMSNSIVYGNSSIEYFLENVGGSIFNYQVKNTLIKFNDQNNHFASIPELDFTDISHYQGIILNQDPNFENTDENKMAFEDSSPCVNKGDISTAQQVPLDISGNDRTAQPDLGAYQHIVFSSN